LPGLFQENQNLNIRTKDKLQNNGGIVYHFFPF